MNGFKNNCESIGCNERRHLRFASGLAAGLMLAILLTACGQAKDTGDTTGLTVEVDGKQYTFDSLDEYQTWQKEQDDAANTNTDTEQTSDAPEGTATPTADSPAPDNVDGMMSALDEKKTSSAPADDGTSSDSKDALNGGKTLTEDDYDPDWYLDDKNRFYVRDDDGTELEIIYMDDKTLILALDGLSMYTGNFDNHAFTDDGGVLFSLKYNDEEVDMIYYPDATENPIRIVGGKYAGYYQFRS